MTPEKLIELAKEAMERAYVPYSGYKNASFTPTICAERTAFFKAVYDGHRDFKAIAVCGGKDGVITGIFPPCGVCRQVMREFCDDDFMVYLAGAGDSYEAYPFSEILPHSFSATKHMDIE